MSKLGKAMVAAVEAETAPLRDQIADLKRQLAEAQERGPLLEKGIRFLLLRITRVEGERNEAIRHEQRFRDGLARILKGE